MGASAATRRWRLGGAKLFSLWYVLASSFLVAWLAVHWLVGGSWSWELGWEVAVRLVAVSLLQLFALWLLSLAAPKLFGGSSVAEDE